METVEALSVVQYVNQILIDAVTQGVSDIHLEPYETQYRIRYRQDGVLRAIASPPLAMMQTLIARIKILANLDIAERRLPQDGRFQLALAREKVVDFRVSSCPTLYGEKLVVRVLNTAQTLPGLTTLGMTTDQQTLFLQALACPQGFILVCGATGSGKSITLYTALSRLNTPEKNISTVEDPIEIPLQGINQVPINPKAGLTFAVVLRALLRQDPDVIMVGEIRDLETAEMAVRAAQTGHLVLSTLHTASAEEAVARLMNMGISPLNIASSLTLIIAQRLVRKLCLACRQPVVYPRATLLQEGFCEAELDTLTLYTAGSCQHCQGGYQGRVGIFQVMPVSKSMSQLILLGADASAIAKLAKQDEVWNVRMSGLRQVRAGLTSLEELNRLCASERFE